MVRESVNQRYVPHARTGKKRTSTKSIWLVLSSAASNIGEMERDRTMLTGTIANCYMVLRGNGLEIFHVASRSEPFLGMLQRIVFHYSFSVFISIRMACFFLFIYIYILYIKCHGVVRVFEFALNLHGELYIHAYID